MTPDRVTPAADADLDAQAAYLDREAGMDTALRFYSAAASTFEAIARAPEIGERRASPNPRLGGLRVWRIEGFENHLVFYRQADDGIEMVRVLHGARDIPGIIDVEQE